MPPLAWANLKACSNAPDSRVKPSTRSAEPLLKSGSFQTSQLAYRCNTHEPAANTATRVARPLCAAQDASHSTNDAASSNQSTSADVRHS